LAWDVGRLMNDPVDREKFGKKVWSGAVWLAKEAYISQGHEGQQAVQDQNERVIAFSKGLWDKVKKSWGEAGNKPGHQTQMVVEAAATIALFFVGGEAAVAGDAEKLDEGAAIFEEVTQPCKTMIMSNEEILAEIEPKMAASAKAADEAANAAKAAKAAQDAKEAAAAAKIARDAEKVGMKTEHVEALVADCAERDRLAVYRKSNPESLKYHDQLSARAKPHDVEVLKTAKKGQENAGLVVHPARPVTQAEAAEITKLEKEGWKFDTKDRLRDPEGNMIHGDYDMQGVYKEVGTDAQGKPIYEKVDTNSESSYFLEDQNEMITPERDMHQHGANDNYTKTGPNGEKVMGRTPGADETYLVVDKNGTQVVESTAELQKVYEANNIPWPY
jgi:hypothetical protein